MDAPLLSVENLRVAFASGGRQINLVEDVSFAIRPGETYALVGESGCGKSVTASAIMRLLPEPRVRAVGGRIYFGGRDILASSEADMRAMRGQAMSMVFQDPMTSLNPVLTIGEQISEGLRTHSRLTVREARDEAERLLQKVRIPDARRRLEEYPHRLSGGMRQRVMIAMAMASKPQLLIADEPTTALDVTVQAEILRLIYDMQQETGTAVLLITHNLAIVAQYADRIGIMYAGRVVEEGRVEQVFGGALHPYSHGLLSCIPHLVKGEPGPFRRLPDIPGVVPEPGARPPGCAFAPRCGLATAACQERVPAPFHSSDGRWAACIAIGSARWPEFAGAAQ